MGVLSRVSVPGAQFGLSIDATARRLTVPADARVAEMYVRTAPIVFTRDGTTPTATKGTQAEIGDVIVLKSRSEIDLFQAIRQSATSATCDVEYFSDVSG